MRAGRAGFSARPRLGRGSRGVSATRPSGDPPAGACDRLAPPPARASGLRSAALFSASPLGATPAAVTPFPRDRPAGRHPTWPTPPGSGERAAGPAATAATSALPVRSRTRSPAPLPRFAQLGPQTRADLLSTYLQSLLSSHHSTPGTRVGTGAAPGPSGGQPPLLSPGPPRPPLGRGASGRLPHATRSPAGPRTGLRLGRTQALGSARRPPCCSQGESGASSLASRRRPCLPAPQPRPPLCRFLLPVPLSPFSFASSGASLANEHLLLETTEN